MKITRINPDGLARNPAFSQGVAVDGSARTIYVGGQNGVGPDGSVVEGGVGPQTERALQNVEVVLAAAGARLEDVVSWSILVVEGAPMAEGFGGFQRVWGGRSDPPALSVAIVAGLANPAFLVEISAIAAIG